MGQLILGDSGQQLYTIERPFISNPDAPEGFDPGVPFKSSVPLGEYDLVLRKSPSRGLRWHFYNPDLGVQLEKADCTDLDDDGEPIWQRYSTMFHVANYVSNVVGCSGVGRRFHKFPDPNGLGVASSANATYALHAFLEGSDKHKLRII